MVDESVELAKRYAHAASVISGPNAVLLTRDYRANARIIARTQAALAVARGSQGSLNSVFK